MMQAADGQEPTLTPHASRSFRISFRSQAWFTPAGRWAGVASTGPARTLANSGCRLAIDASHRTPAGCACDLCTVAHVMRSEPHSVES